VTVPAEARWEAIGTTIHVLTTDPAAIDDAVTAVRAVLDRVDATYSRFRPDSELSRLNAAAGRDVVVSPLLAQALDTALRAAAATDGAVDPTVGRALRAIGYDDDFATLGRRTSVPTIRLGSVPGWRVIHLDRVRRTVRLPRGVELDLGSTGKALAADLAAREAHDAMAGRSGVLVNLGGDIAMRGAAPEGGWRISAADDARRDPAGIDDGIVMWSGGVATSSTTVRRWTRGGIERHHIIDPATGAPADGPWRTVTVAAADCATANAASTGAIVKGIDAERWLGSLGLPARLVAHDGRVVGLCGWGRVLEAARTEAAA
jgi:thiamine biosynthesis lipoprotein ApbE